MLNTINVFGWLETIPDHVIWTAWDHGCNNRCMACAWPMHGITTPHMGTILAVRYEWDYELRSEPYLLWEMTVLHEEQRKNTFACRGAPMEYCDN